MNWQQRLSLLGLVLLVLTRVGCAHYPPNGPLAHYSPDQGYRFEVLKPGENTDSLFICLSFSGGGTRAAALAYGVMEKLKTVSIKWKGVEKRLLDEVDCISSVSGGSFTAAYYTLFKDRLFVDFRSRFLDQDIEHQLLVQLANPVNWLRLASPYFSRIDLAAELYNENIFDQKTYVYLATQGQRPFLILNATNLANGERFEFTQEQFDFLGSDLGSYPLARAVAASSAFPILLSPISLLNYPSPAGYALPKEYENALKDYQVNRRRFHWASNQTRYLDKAARRYLHVMDGGLADNIGLRAVANAHLASNGFIRKLINDGQIEKFVVIVVNAGTEPQEELSREETPPGLKTVAYKTATISMDNYSFETVEFMKDLRDQRKKAQMNIEACQRLLDRCPGGPSLPSFAATVDPSVIEVNFHSIGNEDRRNFFLNLPTGFSLPPDHVQKLIEVGPELLDQSQDFSRFLKSLE